MKEKDLMNKSEIKSGDSDFAIPNEAACSAEFPQGCFFIDEDEQDFP